MSGFPPYPRDAAEREASVVSEPYLGEFAGWGSRVAAFLLDSLILLVPLALLIAILVAADPADDSPVWAAFGLGYVATLILPFVYFSVMHGSARGQTYGKRVLGIRVIDQSGSGLGYGRAFGRYALTFLFGLFVLPLLLDYLWPLWDRQHQALHDKVVGSIVVRA